eukprot:g885.t1
MKLLLEQGLRKLKKLQRTNIDDILFEFSKHDINGDGFLNYSELYSTLRDCANLSHEEVKALLVRFDEDRTGYIDYLEFMNIIENIPEIFDDERITREKVNKVQELIQRAIKNNGYSLSNYLKSWDVDSSGILDRVEFFNGIRNTISKNELSDLDIAFIFQLCMDDDEGGVDLEEFQIFLEKVDLSKRRLSQLSTVKERRKQSTEKQLAFRISPSDSKHEVSSFDVPPPHPSKKENHRRRSLGIPLPPPKAKPFENEFTFSREEKLFFEEFQEFKAARLSVSNDTKEEEEDRVQADDETTIENSPRHDVMEADYNEVAIENSPRHNAMEAGYNEVERRKKAEKHDKMALLSLDKVNKLKNTTSKEREEAERLNKKNRTFSKKRKNRKRPKNLSSTKFKSKSVLSTSQSSLPVVTNGISVRSIMDLKMERKRQKKKKEEKRKRKILKKMKRREQMMKRREQMMKRREQIKDVKRREQIKDVKRREQIKDVKRDSSRRRCLTELKKQKMETKIENNLNTKVVLHTKPSYFNSLFQSYKKLSERDLETFDQVDGRTVDTIVKIQATVRRQLILKRMREAKKLLREKRMKERQKKKNFLKRVLNYE